MTKDDGTKLRNRSRSYDPLIGDDVNGDGQNDASDDAGADQ